jgi:hypothetical protein
MSMMNMKKFSLNNKDGFIKQLILLIIVVIILSYFGLNPLVLWNDYAVPAILWIFGILFKVISFLIEIIMYLVRLFTEA